jgi:hypothetical protein
MFEKQMLMMGMQTHPGSPAMHDEFAESGK